MLTTIWRPVSGSVNQTSPIARQLELARVADLDRQHAVAGAQRAQRRLPVARAAEVGDDDDEPARPREAGAARPTASVSVVPPGATASGRAAASSAARSWASSAEQPEPALLRAQDARLLRVAEGEHAEPVAAARGHVADGERHALGDVGLAPLRGAEGHRGRDVEHEPRGHRALADVHAHVRLAHARGHVPVDVADVVARLVGPDRRELGARADLRREVVARHERLDPAQHGEVERAQDRVRDRPGPGPVGRALGAAAAAALTAAAPSAAAR